MIHYTKVSMVDINGEKTPLVEYELLCPRSGPSDYDDPVALMRYDEIWDPFNEDITFENTETGESVKWGDIDFDPEGDEEDDG